MMDLLGGFDLELAEVALQCIMKLLCRHQEGAVLGRVHESHTQALSDFFESEWPVGPGIVQQHDDLAHLRLGVLS